MKHNTEKMTGRRRVEIVITVVGFALVGIILIKYIQYVSGERDRCRRMPTAEQIGKCFWESPAFLKSVL